MLSQNESMPWSDSHWALAALVYQRFGTTPGFGSLRVGEQRLLEDASGRSARSWKARIDNFTAAVQKRPWSSSPQDSERALRWIQASKDDRAGVAALAAEALGEGQAADRLRELLDVPEQTRQQGDAVISTRSLISEQGFDLLGQLHESPTRAFYLEHKQEFTSLIESPFKDLLSAVVAKLDPAIVGRLETEKRVMASFLKNDFGRGGAWEHYWGALYVPGFKRIESPQLFIWVNRDVLRAGFSVGEYADEWVQPFIDGIKTEGARLRDVIGTEVDGHELLFGSRVVTSDGARKGDSQILEGVDPGVWFTGPKASEIDVNIQLSRDQVLGMEPGEIVTLVAHVFERLFPLVELVLDKGESGGHDFWSGRRIEFAEFCKAVEGDGRLDDYSVAPDRVFSFRNTVGEGFQISERELLNGLRRWMETNEQIADALRSHKDDNGNPDYTSPLWTYAEKPFRSIFIDFFPTEDFPVFRNLGRSQTKSLVTLMRKYVGFVVGRKDCGSASAELLDRESLAEMFDRRGHLYAPAVQDPAALPIVREEPSAATATRKEPDFAWLAEQTFLSESLLREMVDSIDDRGQIILSGVPGNGKTHLARCLAQALTGDTASGSTYQKRAWSLVQFHPSYGYEQFIEGVMPGVDGNGHVVFAPEDGVVLKLAEAVQAAEAGSIHVLVVDELNRANLPRVLGELLYLLEYRDQVATLRFRQQFRLPAGLLFIGTMNTADRSIRSIDAALRRRFDIFELEPNASVLRGWYSSGRGESSVPIPALVAAFDKLNSKLEEQTDSHHRIGHTFFMDKQLTPSRLRKIWERQVFPLIKEALFGVADSDLRNEYESLFAPLWAGDPVANQAVLPAQEPGA